MRQFIISSIEDISSRFGFEANQMLRALAVFSRRAFQALLRLIQFLIGHGAWTPGATLGVLVGNYSLNMPAYLDVTEPCRVSSDAKYVGTGIRQRDCQVGQRDV